MPMLVNLVPRLALSLELAPRELGERDSGNKVVCLCYQLIHFVNYLCCHCIPILHSFSPTEVNLEPVNIKFLILQ